MTDPAEIAHSGHRTTGRAALLRYYVLLKSGLSHALCVSVVSAGAVVRCVSLSDCITAVRRLPDFGRLRASAADRQFDSWGILFARTIVTYRGASGHSSQVQHRRTMAGACRILIQTASA